MEKSKGGAHSFYATTGRRITLKFELSKEIALSLHGCLKREGEGVFRVVVLELYSRAYFDLPWVKCANRSAKVEVR